MSNLYTVKWIFIVILENILDGIIMEAREGSKKHQQLNYMANVRKLTIDIMRYSDSALL